MILRPRLRGRLPEVCGGCVDGHDPKETPAFRFAGDEFVIILPIWSVLKGGKIASGFESTTEHPMCYQDIRIPVYISFGAAPTNELGEFHGKALLCYGMPGSMK